MGTGKRKPVYLTIGQETITLERKPIRHMYLRVTGAEGAVKITAPLSMPEQAVRSFAEAKWDWIQAQKKKCAQSRALEKTLSEEERRKQKEEYRQKLLTVLPDIIKRCEERTGLHAEEWKLRDMKTRWGSCNVVKKRIWLNLQLAAYPEECLEYVVLHELTHLLERGHNQRFWGYMDKFCPDWREVRQTLNGKPDRGRGEVF